MPPTQDRRTMSVTSPLPADTLLFLHMAGSEQLGRLFEYRVQMLSKTADIKIADVLGKNMTLHLDMPNSDTRYFNGIVTRFASTGSYNDFSSYEAIVRPWLWLLTRSSNCCIFQDMSVPDIVSTVCQGKAYGGLPVLDSGQLIGTYPKLTYCVQYRESDFNFVCRLLEQAGIYFYFTHTASNHTMVLVDSSSAHADIPGYRSVPFRVGAGHTDSDFESIYDWTAGGEIQASKYVMNVFDFERASASTSGSLLATGSTSAAFKQPVYEQFDYPGGYTSADAGEALASARIDELQGQSEQISAISSARGLFPGGIFGLSEHPRADQNGKYLVTGAEYEITDTEYRTGSAATEVAPFVCRLSAIGAAHSYRPQRIVPRPCVQGPQTAIVVGKAGEEIWTDQYGRIKVQFHWDRVGKEDEKSSCWVRVAQSWSGKRWGSMFIPRIGMEVVVEFLEGDPDRPLVTGCVYNSDMAPPYNLPANQTRSTIKSNSSKGGVGFNELRFEDKKDREQIFMHAQHNLDAYVKNDMLEWIGNDRHQIVTKNKLEQVDGDQSLLVKGDLNQKVQGTTSMDAGMDLEQKAGTKVGIEAGTDLHIKAGMNLVIEAGMSITLKAGGGYIVIGPASVAISGTPILLNSGGSAGSGAGITTKEPVAPTKADDGTS